MSSDNEGPGSEVHEYLEHAEHRSYSGRAARRQMLRAYFRAAVFLVGLAFLVTFCLGRFPGQQDGSYLFLSGTLAVFLGYLAALFYGAQLVLKRNPKLTQTVVGFFVYIEAFRCVSYIFDAVIVLTLDRWGHQGGPGTISWLAVICVSWKILESIVNVRRVRGGRFGNEAAEVFQLVPFLVWRIRKSGSAGPPGPGLALPDEEIMARDRAFVPVGIWQPI
jgi:hypothetical protein